MYFLGVISVLICNIYLTQSAVFVWSDRKFHISPLQPFSDEDLMNIQEKLNHPDTFIFKYPKKELPHEFKELKEGYFSSYNANGVINTKNATVLTGGPDDVKKIIQQIRAKEHYGGFISVIVTPDQRQRRDTPDKQMEEGTTATPEKNESTASPAKKSTEKPPIKERDYKEPSGPTMYMTNKTKDNKYALLYSAKPPVLKTKDMKENEKMLLGEASTVTVSTNKEGILRFLVNIPVPNKNKVQLTFVFAWRFEYWYLRYVLVTDTDKTLNLNLTTDRNVYAPKSFSYHCGGETVFKNENGSLSLSSMQVQIDAQGARFMDAYDCVNFTTIPIWTGLMVTAMFGIILALGLSMLASIKTMDKFDNHKTKQLVITVSE